MKVFRTAKLTLAVTVLLSSLAAAQYPGAPNGSPYAAGSRLGPMPTQPATNSTPLWSGYGTTTQQGLARLPQPTPPQNPIRPVSNWGTATGGSSVVGAGVAPVNGGTAPMSMSPTYQTAASAAGGYAGTNYNSVAPSSPVASGTYAGAGTYAGGDCGCAAGGVCGDACGECCEPCCEPCCQKCCPTWFGGIYAIGMDRACSDDRVLLYDSANPSSTYLNVNQADMQTAGGTEVRLGRTLCNCCWGLEFVYWGLYPEDQEWSFTTASQPPATVRPTMDYQDVWYDQDDGMGGINQVDVASTYNDLITYARIRRRYEYHNFEVNLLSGPLMSTCGCGCDCGCDYPCAAGVATPGGYYGDGCGPSCACGTTPDSCWCTPPGACCQGPRLQVGWALGFRYFRANEDLYMAYDNFDTQFDYNLPNSELFHDVETENNLIGFQLGLNMDYYLTRCFNIEAGTKFGIFGNDMNVYQRIYNSYGDAYIDSTSPQFLSINENDTDVSFLGELRAGIGYKIGCHWRLTGGYRVLAATCMALPENQLAYGRVTADLAHLRTIDNDASLILHGAYAGLEFAW